MDINKELNPIFKNKNPKVQNVLNNSPLLPKHVAVSIYFRLSRDSSLDDKDVKHAQKCLSELDQIHSHYVCAYLKDAKPLPLTNFRAVSVKDVKDLKKRVANL